MKAEKGITLISLIVYIMAMTIAVTIITVLSSYFYKNIGVKTKDLNPLTEYTKFNSFFTKEINSTNIKILECKDNYIVFNNGTQYTFISENNAVYKNRVAICRNVKKCVFDYSIKNGKDVVTVKITIGNEAEKTTEYTL